MVLGAGGQGSTPPLPVGSGGPAPEDGGSGVLPLKSFEILHCCRRILAHSGMLKVVWKLCAFRSQRTESECGADILAQKLGAGGSCLHCLTVNPPVPWRRHWRMQRQSLGPHTERGPITGVKGQSQQRSPWSWMPFVLSQPEESANLSLFAEQKIVGRLKGHGPLAPPWSGRRSFCRRACLLSKHEVCRSILRRTHRHTFLHLWPWPWLYDPDTRLQRIDILKLYLQTKNEVPTSYAFKSYRSNRTDRQTDRRDWKHHHSHSAIVGGSEKLN